MRFSTIAAALTAPLLATAIPMKHKRASDTDILVLQFAEVLERLETDFYQQALDKFVEEDFIAAGINIPDIAIQNFQGILEHELAHTKFLNAALSAVGAQPVQGCTFNFDEVLTDVATMAAVARVVEAAGVGAYLGAGTLVEDKNILVAAASILTIEARHQTVLNSINGATAVPQSFDIALTPPQVLALAGGFISGCSLGIEANAPLAITNEGPIGAGTLLTFDSPALAGVDPSTLSCQMLVGSPNPAISLPLAECVVPEGINGPVAIFITNDGQPLAADVVVQDGTTTVAGPTLAFLDTVPDALGSLIREGTAPIDSSEQLTPDEASSALEGATGVVPAPTDALAPAPTDGAVAPPPVDGAPAPTDGAVAPPPVDGAPATPENAQQAPAAPLIVELGHSTIPL